MSASRCTWGVSCWTQQNFKSSVSSAYTHDCLPYPTLSFTFPAVIREKWIWCNSHLFINLPHHTLRTCLWSWWRPTPPSTITGARELNLGVFNQNHLYISMILQALPRMTKEEFHYLSCLDRLHQADALGSAYWLYLLATTLICAGHTISITIDIKNPTSLRLVVFDSFGQRPCFFS